MASTKVEAKRFSGKAEQWPHWDQSLQAYLAVNDLIEYFSDGTGVHRDKKDDWKKAQKKIYAYILLVCAAVRQTHCLASTPRMTTWAGKHTQN